MGPAGKIHKFGTSVRGTTMSSNLSTPLIRVLKPPRGRRPNTLPTPGRRRSASMRRTRLPRWAKTTAEFALIVVFPSWGEALVTRTTLGGVPKEDSRMEVRRGRYASAASDFGRTYVISAGPSGFSPESENTYNFLKKLPLLESWRGI